MVAGLCRAASDPSSGTGLCATSFISALWRTPPDKRGSFQTQREGRLSAIADFIFVFASCWRNKPFVIISPDGEKHPWPFDLVFMAAPGLSEPADAGGGEDVMAVCHSTVTCCLHILYKQSSVPSPHRGLRAESHCNDTGQFIMCPLLWESYRLFPVVEHLHIETRGPMWWGLFFF